MGDIKTYPLNPDYGVTADGRVFRLSPIQRRKPLPYEVRTFVSVHGYVVVNLRNADGSRSQHRVNRMVLYAHVGPPPTPEHQSAHNDGNRQNNHVDNLRWATSKDNHADRALHGTHNRGERHAMAKLTANDADQIRRMWKGRGSGRALARQFNVSETTISAIKNGKIWAHV